MLQRMSQRSTLNRLLIPFETPLKRLAVVNQKLHVIVLIDSGLIRPSRWSSSLLHLCQCALELLRQILIEIEVGRLEIRHNRSVYITARFAKGTTAPTGSQKAESLLLLTLSTLA